MVNSLMFRFARNDLPKASDGFSEQFIVKSEK